MPAASVRKLAGEVMAYEEGLPADALGTGGPTWPHERRRRWRSLLETTTRLPDVRSWALLDSPSCPAERVWTYLYVGHSTTCSPGRLVHCIVGCRGNRVQPTP